MWRSSSSTPESPPKDFGTPSSFSHYPDTPPTPTNWTANLAFLPSLPSIPFFNEQPPSQTQENRLTDLPKRISSRSYQERVAGLDLGGFGGYDTEAGAERGGALAREREEDRERGQSAPTEGAAAEAGWASYFMPRTWTMDPTSSPHDSGYQDGGEEERAIQAKRESTQYLLSNNRFYSYSTGPSYPAYMNEKEEEPEGSIGRSNRSSRPRMPTRRIALFSGFLVLLVILWNAFVIFEAVYGLVNHGPQDSGINLGVLILRWVEVALGVVGVGIGMLLVGWLQVRHPSPLSLPSLLFATFLFLLHLGLSIANFTLVFIWYPINLKTRCTWGLDPAWVLGEVGQVCVSGDSLGTWATAAGIRVLIVMLFGSLLLFTLRAFYRSLTPPEIPTKSAASAHPDRLPPMPEHSEFYSLDTSSVSQRSRKEVGWASWFGGRVLGTIGWLFGLDGHDASKEEKERLHDRGLTEEKANVRKGMGSDGLPGQRGLLMEAENGQRMSQWISKPLPPPQQPQQLQYNNPQQQQYLAYQQQSYFRPPSNPYPTANDLDDESVPLYHPSPAREPQLVHPACLQPNSPTSPSSTSTFQTAASLYRDSYRAHDVDSDPAHISNLMLTPTEESPPSSPLTEAERISRFPTGSSGSTGGAYVYVRMSNGKLVRKLSTIASESSVGIGSPPERRERKRTTSNGTTGSGGMGWRKKVPEY